MTDPSRPMVAVIMAWSEWILAGNCWIKDRETGQLVKLEPNKAQAGLMKAMLRQALAGKPIRIIVYKARKMGFSTLVQSLLWFIASKVPLWQSVTVAHSQEDTKQIFEIAKLIHVNAGFPRPSTLSINIPNAGSYIARTAGGHFVQSGSTPNALHISELAKCERVAEMSTEAMSSLLNAVPSTSATTIVVIESTAEGPQGEFHDRVRAAQAGKGEYDLLFFPWFDDPRYTDGDNLSMPDLDDYEASLVRRFDLKAGQILWRRRILQDNHGGNLTQFKRNFPATIDEGFETSEGRCLPAFDRNIHVRKGEPFPKEPSRDYLGIDWGAGASPFVCLWILHYPFKSPGFSMDESCDDLAAEFYSYVRDPVTDNPIHKNCHACFRGDTRILVRGRGWVPIDQLVGQSGETLTPIGWRPFGNVHCAGEKVVWETTLEDGSAFATTDDHQFMTPGGFYQSRELTRLVTLRPHGPGDYQRNNSGILWNHLPPLPRGALSFRERQAPAPCGMGASSWGDPEGVSHSSCGWKPKEQRDLKPLSPAGARAFITNRIFSASGMVETEHAQERYSGSGAVAQISSRTGVAQEAWKEDMARTAIHRLRMRGVRRDVQEPQPSEAGSFLWSELPDVELPKTRRVHQKRYVGFQPVFDLTVSEAHCLILENGIVASNCDALGYAVVGNRMTGWVHVKRALYVTSAAEKGYTLQTLAEAVLKMVGDNVITVATADRAEPLSVNTFANQGIPCVAYKPLPKSPFGGDIEQRIKHLHALMVGADSWMKREPSVLSVAKRKLAQSVNEDGRERFVELTKAEQRAVDAEKQRKDSRRYTAVEDV